MLLALVLEGRLEEEGRYLQSNQSAGAPSISIRTCCTRPVQSPHPWISANTLDPVTRLVGKMHGWGSPIVLKEGMGGLFIPPSSLTPICNLEVGKKW